MIFPHSALPGVFSVSLTINDLSVYSICQLVILMLTSSFSVNQDLAVVRYL